MTRFQDDKIIISTNSDWSNILGLESQRGVDQQKKQTLSL